MLSETPKSRTESSKGYLFDVIDWAGGWAWIYRILYRGSNYILQVILVWLVEVFGVAIETGMLVVDLQTVWLQLLLILGPLNFLGFLSIHDLIKLIRVCLQDILNILGHLYVTNLEIVSLDLYEPILAVIILSLLLKSIVVLNNFNSIVGEILLNLLDAVEVIPFFVKFLFFLLIKFILDLIRGLHVWIPFERHRFLELLWNNLAFTFRQLSYLQVFFSSSWQDDVFKFWERCARNWVTFLVLTFFFPDQTLYSFSTLWKQSLKSVPLSLDMVFFTFLYILLKYFYYDSSKVPCILIFSWFFINIIRFIWGYLKLR